MKVVQAIAASTAVLFIAGAPAFAKLGETAATSKAVALKYLHFAPSTDVVLNSKGRVIFEGWNSPPTPWTNAQYKKVLLLITSGKPVKSRSVDGNQEDLVLTDGTHVEIERMSLPEQHGVISVCAWTKEYTLMDSLKQHPQTNFDPATGGDIAK